MNTSLRRWIWASKAVHNMRDLGGYACEGGMTRFGVVLRSDQLHGLTAEERQLLVDRGLTDVIDLRSRGERNTFPNDFQGHKSVHLHSIRLDHEEDEFQFSPLDFTCMGEMYIKLADANARQYTRMVGVIAEAEGLSIVHCMAGKDRTGIMCALILLALCVDQCDVVADYQVTMTYLGQHIMGSYMTDNPDVPKYLASSDPDNMWMFIEHIEKRYGGALAYLSQNGLTQVQLERLKQRLVAR